MNKIIKFDESPEYKVQKAEEYYNLQEFDVALPLLFDALKQQPDNADTKMFIARIYAEMSQVDLSTETCFSVLADGYNESAVKGIISNLVVQGNFKDARFFAQNFNVDFDFSDFLTVETGDGEVLYGGDDYDEAAEKRKQFKVIVYKNTKDGKNLIGNKAVEDMTVDDLQNLPEGEEMFSFGELMEKLLNIEDVSELNPEPRRTEIGFKQVFPIPNTDCEGIIKKGYGLFTAGKSEEAVALLDTITPDCGKYYFLAQKNKVTCYLALNRLSSMRSSAQEALKGLPDDFSLKCYYYMSLKLLEEETEAEKLFEEILLLKPQGLVDYMVKMDACRLAMYHKGIIECADKVLEDLPYQPQILLLRGKAEYNDGLPKVARSTFLSVLRLYPDNFEARLLIRKIADDDGGLMTYGDIELAIKRVKLLSEINLLLSDGQGFLNYLKYNENAYENLEFLLMNESDRNVYNIVLALSHYLADVNVENLFKKLMLKLSASEYLKTVLISYYLFSSWPKKIVVTVGRRLTIIDLPRISWEKGLTEVATLAADMSFADFIMHENQPKKQILSLTSRLKRVSDYIISENSDRETVKNFLDIKDGVALKKAFSDITRHNVKKGRALNISDEKYFECIAILERIDEEYEI